MDGRAGRDNDGERSHENAHRKSVNHQRRIYFRWNEILRNRGRLWRPRKLISYSRWAARRMLKLHPRLFNPPRLSRFRRKYYYIYICVFSTNFPLSKYYPPPSVPFYLSTRVFSLEIDPTWLRYSLRVSILTRFNKQARIFYILLSRKKGRKNGFLEKFEIGSRERNRSIVSGEKNVWKATGVRLKPIIPLPLRIILEYGETDFNGTKWFPSVSLQPLLGSAERDTGSGHDRIYPWTRVASSSRDSSSRERRRKNICARREQRPILGYVLEREREREKVMNVQNKWFTAPVSVITSASWKNLHVSVMDLSDFSYRLPPRTKWRTNDASGFVRRAIVTGLSTLRALRSILIYRFLSQIVDSLLRESRHADIPDTVLLPEGIPPAQRKRAYRPSIVSGSPNLPPLPL